MWKYEGKISKDGKFYLADFNFPPNTVLDENSNFVIRKVYFKASKNSNRQNNHYEKKNIKNKRRNKK